MRRCVPAIVFAILLFTGRTALADSVAVGDKLHMLNSGGAISGGEFNVDIVGKGNEPPLFDFVTFCVQLRQDINKTTTSRSDTSETEQTTKSIRILPTGRGILSTKRPHGFIGSIGSLARERCRGTRRTRFRTPSG